MCRMRSRGLGTVIALIQIVLLIAVRMGQQLVLMMDTTLRINRVMYVRLDIHAVAAVYQVFHIAHVVQTAAAPVIAMAVPAHQIMVHIVVTKHTHGISPHAPVAAVVQNVLAVIQTVAAMVQVYPVAINPAPRHVHGRHVHLMRPVPMAAHQPVAPNITVVHAVHRLQHAPSAYRVIPAITKAAAVVRHAVVINIIAPVEPARVYHLDIIQQAEHPPPEQVKRNVAVINIIAPVEPARVYHLDIIPQAAHPPREQVKRNVAVINIIAPVEPARVYHLDIIQQAAHPPPEQVKQPVAVINIIAVVVCARVYHLGIIPQAAHPPPEQVKRNAPPAHIAVVELNTIARLAIPTLPPVQMLWKTARYHVQQAR